MNPNEMQFALNPMSVPYLKLETIEIDENLGGMIMIDSQSELSARGDEDEALKIKNDLEVSVMLRLKIQAANLLIEMHILGDVVIRNNQLPFREINEQHAIKAKLLTPFLSKASQLLANLTADNSAFPLIMTFDYDELFVGKLKKGSKKKK